MREGLIHLYTGEGKGKTTAAMGLALRASGAGLKVVIVQFMKGRETSEASSLRLIPNITLIRNGSDDGFWKNMSEKKKESRIEEHNSNLKKALELVNAGHCDLLILDEVVSAYNNGALDRLLIDKLLKEKPAELELVLTGREPCDLFLECADYVTEMKKLKHPFDRGIAARQGIEG